jgi:hypothetical protein
MIDFISPVLALAVAGLFVGRATRSFSSREQSLLVLAFGMYASAAIGQVLITRYYYGGGDMMVYFQTGSQIADLVRYRPSEFLPQVVALFLHSESRWPFWVMGAGTPTGTPSAVSGMLQLVMGKTLYGVCLVVSVGAYFGQLALYRVFREVFPQRLRIRLLVACMMVPSVVFWSSGLLKEALAMAGFGWVVLGLHRIVQRRWGPGLALAVIAGSWVSLIKPYILFALAIAAGVYWYWRRSLDASGGDAVTIRPANLVLGGAAVVALIVGLGELFPRYSIDELAQETARLQTVGARVGGGSYYEIGPSSDRSLIGQLASAPLALFTSLFRPLLFEARNGTMMVNALEATVLLALAVRSVIRYRVGGLWLSLRRSPILMFGVAFVLTFGVAVGLASTNLGTLSRYRVPLMPFWAVLLVVWNSARPGPHQPATAPVKGVRSGRRRSRP